MNIINDTEALRECSRYFSWWPKWATQAITAPCFVLYDKQLPRSYQPNHSLWAELWDHKYNLRLPYPLVRLYCPEEAEGELAHWHLVRSVDGCVEIVTVQVAVKGLMDHHGAAYRKCRVQGWHNVSKDSPEAKRAAQSDREVERELINTDDTVSVLAYDIRPEDCHFGLCGLRDDYHPALSQLRVSDPRGASLMKSFEADTHLFSAFVIHFAYELAYPSNHVVEVVPNKPGKSVEWTRARSHCVLLPTKAIQESQRKGGLTRGETTDIITRCAHDRRGHPRYLKAERYGFDDLGFPITRKPGGYYKVTWVKDTWVGPEEWRSTDRQVVYRMVDFSKKPT